MFFFNRSYDRSIDEIANVELRTQSSILYYVSWNDASAFVVGNSLYFLIPLLRLIGRQIAVEESTRTREKRQTLATSWRIYFPM